MITSKYVVGTGVVISFGCSKIELNMALETLMMIQANAGDGSGLDDIIMAITNTLTEPPPIKRICEKCWSPIDHRIDAYETVGGKHYHLRCRKLLE